MFEDMRSCKGHKTQQTNNGDSDRDKHCGHYDTGSWSR